MSEKMSEEESGVAAAADETEPETPETTDSAEGADEAAATEDLTSQKKAKAVPSSSSSSASPAKKKTSTSSSSSSSSSAVGVQKSKVIYVFRNGDKHHAGAKMTLRPGKTFEQIMQDMNKDVGVATGAVRQVFTPDGTKLKKLEDFEDGGKYVCAGAERLNKELLATAIFEEKKVSAPKPAAAPAKKVAAAPVVAKKPVEKFGTQSEKAKVIFVFRNGDKNHEGVKMTLHNTKFKNFDQVKEGMTKEVKLPTGPVLKVFAPDGKPVKDLAEFEDGAKYVACGAEKLNRDLLPTALFREDKKEEEASAPKAPAPVKAAAPTPKPKAEDDVTKVITVFRNGEKNHEGVKMTVNTRKYKTLDQLKLDMGKLVGVTTGPIRTVCTPEGHVIKSFEELENGGKYLACGAEKLRKDLMPTAIFRTDEESAPKPEPTSAPKPKAAAAPSPKKPIQKFGTQGEKAKFIYVFRNGDKNFEGKKITVSHTKYRNLDQLKQALNREVGGPTGSVRQIWSVEGKLIRTLDEILNDGRYVCGGAEKLMKTLLPASAFEKTSLSGEPAPTGSAASNNNNDATEEEQSSEEVESGGGEEVVANGKEEEDEPASEVQSSEGGEESSEPSNNNGEEEATSTQESAEGGEGQGEASATGEESAAQ